MITTGSRNGNNIVDKKYSELAPGDRVWWLGNMAQITAVLPSKKANVARFSAEFLTGPLKGAPLEFSGLAYGSIYVDVPVPPHPRDLESAWTPEEREVFGA